MTDGQKKTSVVYTAFAQRRSPINTR